MFLDGTPSAGPAPRRSCLHRPARRASPSARRRSRRRTRAAGAGTGRRDQAARSQPCHWWGRRSQERRSRRATSGGGIPQPAPRKSPAGNPPRRRASPSPRRSRRRTAGGGRWNGRPASGGRKSEEVLLSRRVISAKVFSHLAPTSLAARVHPPWCQRNRPQDTQNPAHGYSLRLPDLGVNRLGVPGVPRDSPCVSYRACGHTWAERLYNGGR